MFWLINEILERFVFNHSFRKKICIDIIETVSSALSPTSKSGNWQFFSGRKVLSGWILSYNCLPGYWNYPPPEPPVDSLILWNFGNFALKVEVKWALRIFQRILIACYVCGKNSVSRGIGSPPPISNHTHTLFEESAIPPSCGTTWRSPNLGACVGECVNCGWLCLCVFNPDLVLRNKVTI